MADASILPTYANNKFFFWNAKLTNSLDGSTSATTIYWDTRPSDASGNVTGGFLIAVKNVRRNPNRVELMWCALGDVSADGLSATVVRGLRPSGLDYTTGSSSYVYDFDSGDEVFCAILPQDGELIRAFCQGIIASGGNQISIGDGTAGDKTIKVHTDLGSTGIVRGDGAMTEFSNDGVTWVSLSDSIASVVFKVSANDTTPGYAEDKIVGDGSTITITTLHDGGNETLQIATAYTASPAEINVLDGFTGDTADLNAVVNGGNADAQHVHSGLALVTLTGGETLVAGDQIYIKGLTKTSLTPDHDGKVDFANPNSNFGSDATMDVDIGVGATAIERSLVHFDISAQPAEVVKAYLRVVLTNNTNVASTSRAFRAYLLTGAFDETTLTWNNQPGINVAVYGSSAADMPTAYGTGLGVYFDITTIYNDYWSANNYGVSIRWDDETTGSVFQAIFGTSENGTASRRPELILLSQGASYGRAYKCSSDAQAAGVKGTVVVGGGAGDSVVIAIDGVVGGFTSLTPWALYKANSSGGLSLATNALDAQYLALTATKVKVLDKRKEYSSDILSVTQSIGGFDIAVTELPAGMILDNITAISGSTVAYSQDGYFIATMTTPDASAATNRGISAVDIL